RWIASEATRAGARFVDIAVRPPATASQRVATFLSADRYHPNGHGYAVWAGLVAGGLAGGAASVVVPATTD
ncbi:MAG TPA: hypothetical protein VFO65_03695, partial [Acidimicrobiales bacterium]|nr:hypothetical protein [Acidimicrobiales bacterium]